MHLNKHFLFTLISFLRWLTLTRAYVQQLFSLRAAYSYRPLSNAICLIAYHIFNQKSSVFKNIFILLLFSVFTAQATESNDSIQLAHCKYNVPSHGIIDTCAPYKPVCKGYWVYVEAPSFGIFRKEFFTKEAVEEYVKEFENAVASYKKIYYTNGYDYNYSLIVKPRCWLELPR